LELELSDDSSATQFKYARAGGDEFTMSYMQSLLPHLSVGGSGTYSVKGQSISRSLGFIYDPAEFTLAAQLDSQVRVLSHVF
jgi:hypothetical protein